MSFFTTADFLQALFSPAERVCVTNTGYGTSVVEAASLIDGSVGPRQFFSINPLRLDRRDSNVTAYRTFLIECDKLSKEEQRQYIKDLGLPWTTCVDSGGKSLHYLISLDKPLPDEATYRQLAARIHRVVKKADHSTKNPSRLSRLGGTLRDNGREQRILEIRGKVSREALEAWLWGHDGGLAEEEREVQYWGKVQSALAQEEAVLSKKTLEFVFEGKAPEGRNRGLFMAACEFCRAGYSMKKAEGYLKLAFDFAGRDSDFTDREFYATLESAYRRATQDST